MPQQSGVNECWRRFQMGALMGGSVGACIGIIFGTIYGHGGNGFIRTVGKVVLQSGASFGLFMGIGAFIRCDDERIKDLKNNSSVIL